MEILVVVVGIISFLLVLIALPNWITQRCPICDGRMEFTGEQQEHHKWNGWRIVSRQYACRECLYRRSRMEIQRVSQGGTHETRSVH